MEKLSIFVNVSIKLLKFMNKLNRFLTAVAAVSLSIFISYAAPAETGSMSVTLSDGSRVTVTAVNDNIVKVADIAAGETLRKSASAVLGVQPFAGQMTSSDRYRVMTLPSGLTVRLDRSNGSVSFLAGGKELLADSCRRTVSGGKRIVELFPRSAGTFYGAGERGHSFKLNGDTLVMYNRQNYGYTEGDPRIDQMNICIPLFVNTQGYGVLFDDYAAAEMVLGNPVVYSTESKAPVAYYFIYGGKSLAGVTEEYTRLTGRQPLPPFWSLGYITSKYGYRTEAETRGAIDTLKTQGYPVDGIVLDLYWYGKETDMGRLEWNKEQWPDHKAMLSDLKKQGVNTVIISQPYINKIGAIDNYDKLAESGMLTHDADGKINDVTTWVGEAGMFDVANPDTRRWLRERYRRLTDEGVAGWWGDLGEPEVHPETIVHANGETTREYHNVYGNVWSSIIADLYRDEYPDTRLMTLMRGGTAGLQHHSVFPWSTDVSRSWGGLQPQVKIMMNSGLSGLGYMSHDVGGFAIDEANPIDPELYVRWLQLGVFSPVLRTHSQRYAEPYHYPGYTEVLRDLVKMRYRWLPYNYTLAYENAAYGYPLVRPVNFDDVAMAERDNVTDEYMWGNEVLVAPVIEQGVVSRKVYLPAGVWIDWNNPAREFTGPVDIDYAAPLEVLPLFVRNGAFIPQADYDMENTGDYNPASYTVLYFPRGEVSSSFRMYEDDRKSPDALSAGEYAFIDFEGVADEAGVSIEVTSHGYYAGMPVERELKFVLPAIGNALGAVTVNGEETEFNVDEKNNYNFSVKFREGNPLKISKKAGNKKFAEKNYRMSEPFQASCVLLVHSKITFSIARNVIMIGLLSGKAIPGWHRLAYFMGQAFIGSDTLSESPHTLQMPYGPLQSRGTLCASFCPQIPFQHRYTRLMRVCQAAR